MEAYFIKVNGTLIPVNESDREILGKFKVGVPLRVQVTTPRNYEFLKKYFALLNLAFDYWEPDDEALGEKNFNRFRSDVTILAGYYEQYIRVDGSLRIEPKSVSFGKMTEDEFTGLYNNTIDALIKYVLPRFTGEELREAVDAIQGFE